MGALHTGNTVDEYGTGLINGVSGANMITSLMPVSFVQSLACRS